MPYVSSADGHSSEKYEEQPTPSKQPFTSHGQAKPPTASHIAWPQLAFSGLPSSYSHERKAPDLQAASKAYLPASMDPGPPSHSSFSELSSSMSPKWREWTFWHGNTKDANSRSDSSYPTPRVYSQPSSIAGSTTSQNVHQVASSAVGRKRSGTTSSGYYITSSAGASNSDIGTAGQSSSTWGRSQRSSQTSLRSQPSPKHPRKLSIDSEGSYGAMAQERNLMSPEPNEQTKSSVDAAVHKELEGCTSAESKALARDSEDDNNWRRQKVPGSPELVRVETETETETETEPTLAPAVDKESSHPPSSSSSSPQPEPQQLLREHVNLSPIPGSLKDESPDKHSIAARSRNVSKSTTQESKVSAAGRRERLNTAKSASEDLIREDAKRQYEYLQNLHFQELAAYDDAFEHQGVLMANNGCEQVFMPKPRLSLQSPHSLSASHKTMIGCLDGYDEDQPHVHTGGFDEHRRRHLSFERNRRPSRAALRAEQAAQSDEFEHNHRTEKADPVAPLERSAARESGRPRQKSSVEPSPFKDSTVGPAALRELSRKRSASQPSRPAKSNLTHEGIPPLPLLPSKHHSSDNDAVSLASSLDLNDVIEQGRALDEERAAWRARFMTSIEGRSRGARMSSRQTNDTKSKDGAISGRPCLPARKQATPLSESNHLNRAGAFPSEQQSKSSAKSLRNSKSLPFLRLSARRKPAHPEDSESQPPGANGAHPNANTGLSQKKSNQSMWPPRRRSRDNEADTQIVIIGRDGLNRKQSLDSAAVSASRYSNQQDPARRVDTPNKAVPSSSRRRISTSSLNKPLPQSPPPSEPLPTLPVLAPVAKQPPRKRRSERQMYAKEKGDSSAKTGNVSTSSLSSAGDHSLLARVIGSLPVPPRRRAAPHSAEVSGNLSLPSAIDLQERIADSASQRSENADDYPGSSTSSLSRHSSVLFLPQFGSPWKPIVDLPQNASPVPGSSQTQFHANGDEASRVNSLALEAEAESYPVPSTPSQEEILYTPKAGEHPGTGRFPGFLPEDEGAASASFQNATELADHTGRPDSVAHSTDSTLSRGTAPREQWRADLDSDRESLRNLFFKRLDRDGSLH